MEHAPSPFPDSWHHTVCLPDSHRGTIKSGKLNTGPDRTHCDAQKNALYNNEERSTTKISRSFITKCTYRRPRHLITHNMLCDLERHENCFLSSQSLVRHLFKSCIVSVPENWFEPCNIYSGGEHAASASSSLRTDAGGCVISGCGSDIQTLLPQREGFFQYSMKSTTISLALSGLGRSTVEFVVLPLVKQYGESVRRTFHSRPLSRAGEASAVTKAG